MTTNRNKIATISNTGKDLGKLDLLFIAYKNVISYGCSEQ